MAYPSCPAKATHAPSGDHAGSSAPPGWLVSTRPVWRGRVPSGTSAICVGPGSLNNVTANCEPSGDQETASTASSCKPGVARTRRPLPSAAFINHSVGKVDVLSDTNAMNLPSGDHVGRKFQSLLSSTVDWEVVSLVWL